MKYPRGIKAVYDNGYNQYAIYFNGGYYNSKNDYVYNGVVSSANPTNWQKGGFYQHFSAKLGKHTDGRKIGRKISWVSLPKIVRNRINTERKYYA